MKGIIIENTGRYFIKSYGNGAAYEMGDKVQGKDKFVQYGDDAVAFREEYDNMCLAYLDPRSAWHNQTWDNCLDYLWEQI